MPALDTSVFIIPGERVKNGDERLVVLNRVAKSVVESHAASIPTHVFVQAQKEGEPKPVAKMSNTGRKSARERAERRQVGGGAWRAGTGRILRIGRMASEASFGGKS